MDKCITVPPTFISLDPEKCSGRSYCMIICGGAVLKMRKGKAVVVRPNQCLKCGNCEVICPTDAIQYTVPKG